MEQKVQNQITWLAVEKTWDRSKMSDWYHTFWELYDHRIALYIALCRYAYFLWEELDWVSNKPVVRSHKHDDWTSMPWWFILQFESDVWQISYHLPEKYWDKCSFAETKELANKWDGHTSEDVLDRLLKF